MILVLDDEVRPDYRYLGPEIARILPDDDYHVFAADADAPAEAQDGASIPSLDGYDGVVLSGSTASVTDEWPPWMGTQVELVHDCIRREIPLLGVCFGHQLINVGLDGSVETEHRRSTFVEMDVHVDDPVLDGVNPTVPVLHSDVVVEPGDGMVPIASTSYNENFCTRHADAPVWTVQYHPEFTERVEDRPSDWARGDGSFDVCNATRTLTNFADVCRERA